MFAGFRRYRAMTSGALTLIVVLAAARTAAAQAPPAPATPPEMVAAYSALADTILAVKQTEHDLVRAILAATYAHGDVQLSRARQAIVAGDAAAARAAIEALAADVGHLATEGDAAVAAVRRRLIDGGHHHHAGGDADGEYDEGFVIVTRDARQQLLERSRAIGGMAAAPVADTLAAEWQRVVAIYTALVQSAD